MKYLAVWATIRLAGLASVQAVCPTTPIRTPEKLREEDQFPFPDPEQIIAELRYNNATQGSNFRWALQAKDAEKPDFKVAFGNSRAETLDIQSMHPSCVLYVCIGDSASYPEVCEQSYKYTDLGECKLPGHLVGDRIDCTETTAPST